MSFNSQDSHEVETTLGEKEEETTLQAISKIADVASKNEAVALIIASAISTSIVIYVAAKSAALLIGAWHLVNCCLA